MYHHSEGYPNAPQHSNTEGSPAPPSLRLYSNNSHNCMTSVSRC